MIERNLGCLGRPSILLAADKGKGGDPLRPGPAVTTNEQKLREVLEDLKKKKQAQAVTILPSNQKDKLDGGSAAPWLTGSYL